MLERAGSSGEDARRYITKQSCRRHLGAGDRRASRSAAGSSTARAPEAGRADIFAAVADASGADRGPLVTGHLHEDRVTLLVEVQDWHALRKAHIWGSKKAMVSVVPDDL